MRRLIVIWCLMPLMCVVSCSRPQGTQRIPQQYSIETDPHTAEVVRRINAVSAYEVPDLTLKVDKEYAETTPDVILEAVTAAKKHGTIVSYDLNYRKSLWQDIGGQQKARQVNRAVAPYVDVMLGNEEDFTAALGFEVKGMDKGYSKLDPANFKKMIAEVVKEFPSLKVVATTLRNAKTASVNDWGAIIYAEGEFHEATLRTDLEIYDRVGGGDSFASGLIYGLMEGKTPEEAVNYGAAHGALAMTTPGDTTTASLREVEKVMGGGSARVDR